MIGGYPPGGSGVVAGTHHAVFTWVLKLCLEKKLLTDPSVLGVDSWTFEANAAIAHVCETGVARRSWLRGFAKIRKRFAMAVVARNLGLLMRKLFLWASPGHSRTGGTADGTGKSTKA